MSKQLTLAEAARTLVQQGTRATLSTLCDKSGVPYGSIVEIAPTDDGSVVMLLSQLAEHRRFLDADPRASVLIAPDLHMDNALAKPRISLMGQASQIEASDEIRDHYLARHPAAEMYLSLGDFHFYQLQVTQARYIAGFGKMGWLNEGDYHNAQPDLLWEIGPGAIEHMNDDHNDALLSYVRVLADKPWAQSATPHKPGSIRNGYRGRRRRAIRIGTCCVRSTAFRFK